MPRASVTTTSFNAGELTPLLDGRTDTDIYTRGCKTLINYTPSTQGAAIKRQGTVFVAAVKNATDNVRLIEFIFSDIDSYILEFGDQYIRFYQTRIQVQSGGSPLEVATNYLESEVADIKFVQIGDIMYITHKNHQPRKLSRVSALVWTIADIDNKSGPVTDRDPDETVTMTITGTITVGGSMTATASAATFGTGDLGFQTDHVGSLWSFSEASNSLSPFAEWAAGTAFGANIYVRRDGRLYFTSAGGTTGTFPPIHEDGTVSDGVVSWLFVNFGVGYARMTARTSATVAVFTVQRHIPPTITSASPIFVATAFWNEAAWSSVRGFPRAVAFHEERLFFAGTDEDPLVIDGSRSNRRFEDFDPSQAEDDASIRYELSGRINNIQWLISDGDFLLGGTIGGLAFLGSGSETQPLTPTNVKANTGSSFGASSIQALELFNSIQYVQKQGRKVFQTSYDFLSLKYQAQDLTVNNPEISAGGPTDRFTILETAKQEEPYVTLYGIRSDGILTALVQENNQSVLAWSRFVTGLRSDDTFDKFQSVSVIPSTDNDEIWVVVERNVNAGTVKYIEFFQNDPSETQYSDSSIKFDGAATTTIPGLTHLESEDVSILADGAVVAVQAVSGGTITLTTVASVVYVGRPYDADLEPMLLDGGSANGSAQTKTKRINELAIRLYRTLGLKAGFNFDNLKEIPFRETNMPMDNAPDLFAPIRADDKIFHYNGSWDDGNIAIRSSDPLPATIVSITPRFVTNDK